MTTPKTTKSHHPNEATEVGNRVISRSLMMMKLFSCFLFSRRRNVHTHSIWNWFHRCLGTQFKFDLALRHHRGLWDSLITPRAFHPVTYACTLCVNYAAYRPSVLSKSMLPLSPSNVYFSCRLLFGNLSIGDFSFQSINRYFFQYIARVITSTVLILPHISDFTVPPYLPIALSWFYYQLLFFNLFPLQILF